MAFDTESPPFKLVKGYSRRYLVTREGTVFDFVRGRVVARFIKNGYLAVGLQDENGKSSNKYLHRILATAFIPNPSGLPCINHKNGDKLDDRIENLEWCTYGDNTKHAYRTGLNYGRKTPIMCVDTGEVFSSVKECCGVHQIKYKTLLAHLNHENKICHGKHYIKLERNKS